MKAIIAAGGSGTRLRPLTFSSNKHLLPIANKPILLYPLEAIMSVGIKDIGVVVNETRPAVESLLGNGSQWGVKITYINQEKPLGLAHVIKICQSFLEGQPFVYHLGDNIFTRGIKRPYDHFMKSHPNALLTIKEHPENFRMGVPFFNDKGKLIKVVEKPEKPPNRYGVPGLYFFDNHVFEAYEGSDSIKPSARGELEITELYTYLIDHNYRVETEEIDGRWMDPGKFTDMLDANAFLLEQNPNGHILGKVDKNSRILGKVHVGADTEIISSQIVGPVNIAEGCIIQGCLIGPNVSIAKHCKLESIRLANSIIMESTTIFDVKTEIRDSLIGKNAEIWEEQHNSLSLFVGDHCKIRVT